MPKRLYEFSVGLRNAVIAHMLSKIPALDRWADSMIKSMTGSEVKYRQVWIDDEGNMGSMCITGPSEAQKKENEDKKIEEKKEYEKNLQNAG